ncbi:MULTISPECIES: pyridoxamine 5'-phosphate oxidase family protein [unclassified Arthrobacter]|uniref:pyridoxamine 5'-phosphate oxidase family protein n=1 Tax=Arthrobacter sp. UYEF21 TaxID=1756364 RepID=UPI003393D812
MRGKQPRNELSAHDCWKYLQTSSVGRLAVVVGGSPEIFPVNYLPDEGSAVFRTGPGTKLDAIVAGGPLALEADGLNTSGTIAWSVVLKGFPEEVQDVDDLPQQIPSPWEEGAKEHVIRIVPTELSGRRFVIAGPEHWWLPRDRATGGT